MTGGRVATTTTGVPWAFRAAVTRTHDGDSFFVMCDLGFSVRVEVELRLDGVHAPEIRPMQPGGQETTDFINGWLSAVSTREAKRRWPLWVVVTPTHTYEPEMDMTFVRYVATVWEYGKDATADSLNYAVNTFLSGHPEWPSGD